MPRTRRGVTDYLAAAVAACLVAIVVLVAVATTATTREPRASAVRQLRAAAHDTAVWLDPVGGVDPLLRSLASDPGITSLDPARCQPVFDAIAGGVMGAHVHVLDGAGHEVCSLRTPSDHLRDGRCRAPAGSTGCGRAATSSSATRWSTCCPARWP